MLVHANVILYSEFSHFKNGYGNGQIFYFISHKYSEHYSYQNNVQFYQVVAKIGIYVRAKMSVRYIFWIINLSHSRVESIRMISEKNLHRNWDVTFESFKMQTFCLSFKKRNIYRARCSVVSIANALANVAKSSDSSDKQSRLARRIAPRIILIVTIPYLSPINDRYTSYK